MVQVFRVTPILTVALLGIIAIFVGSITERNSSNKISGELLFKGKSHSIYTVNADGSGLVVLVEGGKRPNYPHPSLDWYITWLRMKVDNYERRPPLFIEITNQDATWSPDGSSVAYLSDRDGEDSIYLIREGNPRPQRLTQGIHIAYYVWLSATRILFYSHYPDEQVYLLNINTNQISPINCLNRGSIFPSPDGTQIATIDFVSNAEYENDQWDFDSTRLLVLMKPDCSQRRVIAEQEYGFCDIEWSPDGKHLLFVDTYFEPDPSDPEGNGGTIHCNKLYRVSHDGSELIRLNTDDISHMRYLAWSPDGQRIAFTSQQISNKGIIDGVEKIDVNEGVYIMNHDGSNVLRISKDPARDVHPVWSPTGDQIAFVSLLSNKIYVYNIDEANTSIATDRYRFGPISWRP